MRTRLDPGRLNLNARLVREKDRARARELRWLLLACAAVAIPLLIYVWQRVDFIRLSYQVEKLEQQERKERDLNEQLRVERSHLLAMDRIERLARRRLGLVEPPAQDVRRVVVIDGTIDELGGQVAGRMPGQGRGILAAGAAGLGPLVPLPSAPGSGMDQEAGP